MEKQELVVYGENNEIVQCSFERVDFDEPSSLITYFDDVVEEIGSILESIAQMNSEVKEIQVDDKMVSYITSFEENLDEGEKKREKEENLPAVVRKAKGLVRKITGKKEVLDELTYTGMYQDWCDKVDEVRAAVESEKQGTLHGIQLKDTIIKEVEPLLAYLDEKIKVGELDRKAFDEKIEGLKARLASEPENLDLQYQIDYMSQLSGVFNEYLDSGKTASAMYKGQIQNFRIQKAGDMQLVMENDKYLKLQLPVLKTLGSTAVFSRQQEKRIESMTKLNEATNTAIIQSSENIEKNAAAIRELALNNGRLDALKKMQEHANKGIAILDDLRVKKQAQVEQNAKVLEEISSSFDESSRKILGLIDDEKVMSEIINGGSSSTFRLPKSSAPQKKIGKKK